MNKKRNLTAKDKAFLREKEKYKKTINKLHDLLSIKEKELYEKNQKINELENELISKDEWIERLLQLTNIAPNQIENYLQEIHYHHQIEKEISDRLDFISKFI